MCRYTTVMWTPETCEWDGRRNGKVLYRRRIYGQWLFHYFCGGDGKRQYCSTQCSNTVVLTLYCQTHFSAIADQKPIMLVVTVSKPEPTVWKGGLGTKWCRQPNTPPKRPSLSCLIHSIGRLKVKWLSLSRNNKTIQNFLEVSVYLRVLVTSREKPFFKFLVTSYETHT